VSSFSRGIPSAGRDAVDGQLVGDEAQHEGHGTDGIVDAANGGEARAQADDARHICELDERFDRGAAAPGPVPEERGRSPPGLAIRATATIVTFFSFAECSRVRLTPRGAPPANARRGRCLACADEGV